MWNSDAAYDNFMGRFSSRLAPLFADFAGVDAGERVLDVGAGTGMLTQELVRRGAHVSAIEPAPAFAESLRRRFPDLDVREGPAEQLPWDDGSFDVALAQLVIAFMADAPTGVAEMARAANGRVAVCMWDGEEMELLRSVNRVRERMGDQPAQARRYRTAAEIEALLGPGAEVTALDVVADYEGFEDYWESVLGGSGPAGEWVASLDEARRETARAELLSELGNPSGPFQLSGRAWAGRISG